ncbi:MAG: BREX-2 system adenine-specific DNA-methyltransferase PglX [Verrucomicrobia bacterium]|nr:BREX-2 system adenine-specific DNA-methyltransferase PglX [Verrucomicrobiota bacterium]
MRDPLSSSDPTRFLGDLYQDLSEAARKKYALLQTPEFIEEFILDRTLTPAIETFGYQVVRLIDPTCGSGHFLLGAFIRLFRLWLAACPGENPRVLAQFALNAIYGVDLNPYAVAIARFRLLLAALQVCGITKLKNAPDFTIHLASGDSLLHGRRFRESEGETRRQSLFETDDDVFRDELKHHYQVEDGEALHRILGQQYHAVVGNPPYITVKDRAVSDLYRLRYSSCHRQYSLSVPFMERFFDLAIKGDCGPQYGAGFVGQITANSFMKRELGKKLIEEYLPRWDLTHVLDTSGAYIPGHGTPTVILLGKNQLPMSKTIRTVLGIRAEPAKPAEPALGLVWQAIVQQIDQSGSESEWVSAGDSPRAKFHQHPWSIGGGGAAELKESVEDSADSTLGEHVSEMGF